MIPVRNLASVLTNQLDIERRGYRLYGFLLYTDSDTSMVYYMLVQNGLVELDELIDVAFGGQFVAFVVESPSDLYVRRARSKQNLWWELFSDSAKSRRHYLNSEMALAIDRSTHFSTRQDIERRFLRSLTTPARLAARLGYETFRFLSMLQRYRMDRRSMKATNLTSLRLAKLRSAALSARDVFQVSVNLDLMGVQALSLQQFMAGRIPLLYDRSAIWSVVKHLQIPFDEVPCLTMFPGFDAEYVDVAELKGIGRDEVTSYFRRLFGAAEFMQVLKEAKGDV